MRPATSRRLFAVLVIGGALAALSATSFAGAAPNVQRRGAATPKWQDFKGLRIDGDSPVLGAGWAAGRVWFTGRYRGDSMIIGSARISRGKLASFVNSQVADSGGTLVPFLGDELAYYTGNTFDEFHLAPLLPSGRLGASKPVPEDFLASAQRRIPKACSARALDGTAVGSRRFWAVGGASQKKGCQAEVFGGDPFFLACCAEDGATSNPIPHINSLRGALGVDISADTKGRIWLLWLDNTGYTGANRGIARLVEIDPATMALRTPPYAVPGGLVDNLKLACGPTCRAVVQTPGGNLASWAPGERSATTIVRKVEIVSSEEDVPRLLDASYVAGRLVVAYRAVVGKRADPRDTVLVARGDARGRNAKVASTIETTVWWPPAKPRSPLCGNPDIYGMFVPRGLAALTVYRFGDCPVVLGTFLPLTG